MGTEQPTTRLPAEYQALFDRVQEQQREFDARVAHWASRYRSDDPPAPPDDGGGATPTEEEARESLARLLAYTQVHPPQRVVPGWEQPLDKLRSDLIARGFPGPWPTLCVKYGKLDLDEEITAHLVVLDVDRALRDRVAALMRVGPRNGRQLRSTHACCIEPVVAAWIDQYDPAAVDEELEVQIGELLRQATAGALDENLRVIAGKGGWDDHRGEVEARAQRLRQRAAGRSPEALSRLDELLPARPWEYD